MPASVVSEPDSVLVPGAGSWAIGQLIDEVAQGLSGERGSKCDAQRGRA